MEFMDEKERFDNLNLSHDFPTTVSIDGLAIVIDAIEGDIIKSED